MENDTRRQDAHILVGLFSRVTGWEPVMWGPSIIGFGSRDYAYDSGRTGTICALGFSPRKANLAFYLGSFPELDSLLAQLVKHKGGSGSCLYINKLADVDLAVLEKIVRGSFEAATSPCRY